MSTPHLPVEIIDEIASYLRDPRSYKFNDQLEVGKTFSIVCRTWSGIGRALRWERVGVDIRDLPSLSAHFALHPRLIQLVKAVKQDCDLVSEGAAQDEEDCRAFKNLLGTLVGLDWLEINQPTRRFDQILLQASLLPNLLRFRLFALPHLVWTPRLSSIFIDGFPSLRSFSLSGLRSISQEENRTSISPEEYRKKVPEVSLSLCLCDYGSTIPRFLANFDVDALRKCSLYEDFVCSQAFDWLTTCSNLDCLRIDSPSFKYQARFTSFLSHLRRLVSLRKCRVFLDPGTISLPSPITLVEVIISFPPNLRRFEAKQLVFPEHGMFKVRQIPSDSEAYRLIVALLPKSLEGDHPVLRLWNDTRGDENSWYREETEEVV